MRSITFIALLFCMALACLTSGLMALYENIDLRLHGQVALMELADPTRKVTLPVGGYDVHLLDVRYVSQGKSVVVLQKRLVGDIARQLVAGGKVPVTYYTNDPQRARLVNDEMANPLGWLVVGGALFATFVYALKLRRQQSA